MLCISFLRSAELQLRLALTAPLERRKGDTKTFISFHLRVVALTEVDHDPDPTLENK